MEEPDASAPNVPSDESRPGTGNTSAPEHDGSKHGAGGPIFVCDASAEAERLMGALKTRGYPTIDVPLGLLTSRVRYQVPALVVCDADAHEALARVLELAHAEETRSVRVMFVGNAHGALERDESFKTAGVASFTRPIDVEKVCSAVEELLGPPSPTSSDSGARARRAPAIVHSARKPYRSDELPVSSKPLDLLMPLSSDFPRAGDAIGGRSSLMPPSSGHGAAGPSDLSLETRTLLERAHLAVSSAPSQAARPTRLSPDVGAQAQLPDDVLAALDAPLDELGEPVDVESQSGTAGGAGSMGPPRTEAPPRPHEEAAERAASPSTPSYPSDAAVTNPGGRAAASAPPSLEPPPQPVSQPTASPTRLEASQRAQGTFVETRADLRVEGRALPPPPRQTLPEFSKLDEADLERDWPDSQPLPTARPTKSPTFLPHEAPSSPMAALSEAPESVLSIPPGPSLEDITAEPEKVGLGGAARALAAAIRQRKSGALALQSADGIRRVVLRDGDIVTAASGIEDESLVRFLESCGDMDAATADQLARVLPPFGRHAGAALVANGHLQQDALWPVLRTHSESILAAVVSMAEGHVSWEEVVPLRLQDEPAVFGGAAGAEVFVESVRRSIEPARAYRLLGSGRRFLGVGPHRGLLGECALGESIEADSLEALGRPLSPLLESSPELLPILYALLELGVFSHGTTTNADRDSSRVEDEAAHGIAPKEKKPARRADESAEDPFDDEAFRARVLARRSLVDDGDYFSILGVARTATAYEVARAHDALRTQLDPKRLTPRNFDLKADLDLVLLIVDEAKDVLFDNIRRERYRRALEAPPLGAYQRP